jgi:hypothetical protein
MRVKMVRQSGAPVELDKLEKFDKEFKEAYDKIVDKHGNDMEKVHQELEGLDAILANKYDPIFEITLPTSGKKWKEMIDTYGQIMVTTNLENGQPILVVLDLGIQ